MLLLRKQASHPFSSPLWEFLYSELPAQVCRWQAPHACFARLLLPRSLASGPPLNRSLICLFHPFLCVPQHVGGGRLWLGVPSIIEHRVEEGSPLFGLGDNEMRAMGARRTCCAC